MAWQAVYKEKYQARYLQYQQFLQETKLLTPQTRYDEADIVTLQRIHQWEKEGRLDELKARIHDDEETLRDVSHMFFRNEKYLDNRPSLIRALKQLLQVEHFANDKDQQYVYKLECHNPKVIVLCENLDFLMKPVQPRKHQVELWYAGGKNVEKLRYADTRGLPVYYSCDWDFDGLYIIYPLVREKIPGIQLLTPTGVPKSIKESEHNSKWDAERQRHRSLLLQANHQTLLAQIIADDQWIIEQSNDLIGMLRKAQVELN